MALKIVKLQVKRTSPVEDVGSEIEVHGPMNDGDFEFVIRQTIHDNRKRRYKPGKLVIFSVSPDQLAQLCAIGENAVVRMQPADVLSEFGLTDDETGEAPEAYAERLKAAGQWLANNRKHIEDAMTRAGFEAISLLADGPQPFKLGAMPEQAELAAVAAPKAERYAIEHNGESWRSVFPAGEAEKSQLHADVDDAFAYMTLDCGVAADAIEIPPVKLTGRAWKG